MHNLTCIANRICLSLDFIRKHPCIVAYNFSQIQILGENFPLSLKLHYLKACSFSNVLKYKQLSSTLYQVPGKIEYTKKYTLPYSGSTILYQS